MPTTKFDDTPCKGRVDIFFPSLTFDEKGKAIMKDGTFKQKAVTAKKICRDQCILQRECLEGAIARRENWGVWGGVHFADRRERTEILRKNKVRV